ncbi:MAG: hypothetical protein ACKOYK_11465 [Cyanobium sp.]
MEICSGAGDENPCLQGGAGSGRQPTLEQRLAEREGQSLAERLYSQSGLKLRKW